MLNFLYIIMARFYKFHIIEAKWTVSHHVYGLIAKARIGNPGALFGFGLIA